MTTPPGATRSFVSLGLVAVALAALALTPARAQDATAVDEAQLVERIKAEVMKELRDSDFMRQAVEQGIQDYIKKQQEARAEAAAARQRAASERAKNVRRVSADRDHIYGNPDAKISLIEYSDFECPYCKRFHDTPRKLVDESNGEVNWVYRHFPLAFHNPGAQKQAEGSECAGELGGNEAFWKFTDTIYARTKSNGKGFPIDKLAPLAEEIGLDRAAFEDCLNSGRFAARVNEDFEEGGRAGITGTPGNILLNNETGEVQLKSGAQPLSVFKQAVQELLAGTKKE